MERIRLYVPHARLIAVLRHPVDRAYSSYLMMVQLGREHLFFAQALDAEEECQQMNWSCGWRYRANGFYYCLLQPYLERFPREQIRIYLYDDWDMKPLKVLLDIFRFLQVGDTFVPKSVLASARRWSG